VNCWPFPFAIDALAGLTARETNTGGVTVKVAEPLTAPDDAVIFALP
jgi:hypothetical protein